MEAIIENGLVLQPNYSLKQESVVIDGKMIVAKGTQGRMRQKFKRYKRIDASNQLVLPGFINSHTHIAMGLAQGLGDGLPLKKLFPEVLFPLEKKMNEEIAFLGAMIAGIELIRTGSTTINNINGGWSKPVTKALKKLGLRASLAIACKDTNLETKERTDFKGLDENIALFKRLEKEELLTPMYGLANEVEASEKLIKTLVQNSVSEKTGLHLHVAESEPQTGFIMQKTGKTSVRYLYDLGALNEKSLAVHCVNVTAQDIPLLAKSRVTVVHCPTMNLNMASGIAPIPEMFNSGVSVAVGVDDPIANMSNDIRRELLVARSIHRTKKSLSLKQLMSMLWNSRILEHSVGSIREGAFADLLIVSPGNNFIQKDELILKEVLFSNSPVTSSIVNGEFVLHAGKIPGVNEKNLFKKASDVSRRLFK